MAFDYILFDLDGTLTDPEEGITNSVAYALEKFGIAVGDKKSLRKFIGPPLIDSFKQYYGFSDSDAKKALMLYREYFCDKGMFQNAVYDGIAEMLSHLKTAGKKIVLATSKPEVYAKQILEHFSLSEYFDYFAGATLDEKRAKKEEIIEYILDNFAIVPEKAVMVGDRCYDIDGAHKFGVKAVGVLFGYGGEAELQSAEFTAATVEELEKILLSN